MKDFYWQQNDKNEHHLLLIRQTGLSVVHLSFTVVASLTVTR